MPNHSGSILYLQLMVEASNTARKSKSLYVLSRALGELSRLQILAGKQGDAQASIDEALQLDEINGYDWKAYHLLVMAWANTAESKIDKAMELADSARILAISNDNYVVFIQASQFLGQAYVHKGQIDKGIKILELAQKGLTEENKSAFHSPQLFAQAVSQPYLRVIFLEALSLAYEAGNRADDALSSWQRLYDSSAAAHFSLAEAESAHHLADLYRSTKKIDKAIEYYSVAAEAFAASGDEQNRIQVLSTEASLLGAQGQKDRALMVLERVLTLTKSPGATRPRFIADLAVAELLDGSGNLDRADHALRDAETLVGTDLNPPNIQPSYLLELYLRLADVRAERKDVQHELVDLEKALAPALALATAPKEAANNKPLGTLVERLEGILSQYHLREEGDAAYMNKNYSDALLSFELLQYFEEFDASWKGHAAEYAKNLNSDPVLTRLLEIPAKLVSQGGGAESLATNLDLMGPLAARIRPSGFGLLATHYMSEKRFDLVAKYLQQALTSFGTWADHSPSRWSVAASCELAYAYAMETDTKTGEGPMGFCMAHAEKLGVPTILQAAHETNISFLIAAGRPRDAENSLQYILKNQPDEPLTYQLQAQLRDLEGDRDGAVAAWTNVIRICESKGNIRGAAEAHEALGNLFLQGTGASAEQGPLQLRTADDQYRTIGSNEGRISVEGTLGEYYGARRNPKESRQYFEGALKLAREIKRKDLEANVLQHAGLAYERSGDSALAIQYYTQSASLDQDEKDIADQAVQLKNVANVLITMHKSEDAMATILRAKALADQSGSWFARYWVRRVLAELDVDKGDYQEALIALQQAKQISADANQPLRSAWAALASAADLETVGNWQEASDQVTAVLPVFVQFKDVDDEAAAYGELMAIYSARESDLRDLPQALAFYDKAYQLVLKRHPDKAAVLNLDLTEIYWNQGRFKDAILKANEALVFYKTLNDDLGEASALISLAEAQRSNGDLSLASGSLQLAEPLVMRAKNFYTFGRFYYVRAGLYRAQGRFDDAVSEYERVIGMLEEMKSSSSDPEERRHVANSYEFIYDELIETYYALAQSDGKRAGAAADKALEYAELNKARVFANLWGRAFADGLRRELPISLREREESVANDRRTLQSDLQQAMMKVSGTSMKEIEARQTRLEKTESQLESDTRNSNAAYAEIRYPQHVNIGQIPLRSGELLVQFKMLDEKTLVWLLTGTPHGTTLASFYEVRKPKQWFAERVFRIRDAFNSGHPEQFDSGTTDELFSALFPDSVLQNIETAKTVIAIPDGVLFLLPLEMLSSHGKYPLIAKPTEYFPSSAALRLARTSIHPTGDWQETLLGIADPITSPDDPRYLVVNVRTTVSEQQQPEEPRTSSAALDRIVARGFSLERLPGTADEVQGIAKLFPSIPARTDIRMGTDATKEELLRTDLGRYRFIHFATHGLLPVESGIKEPALVLSYESKRKDDMLLTLSEILEFKLSAEMVVLSACNTGSGKVTRAEGVASLGSAFLAAGASSVMVSLWQVSDNSTALLMEEFYRNLVGGKSKSASLAAARETLVSKGYDNPFFWAPFVLTGE
jgi:CHAT domain-containing protein